LAIAQQRFWLGGGTLRRFLLSVALKRSSSNP